MNYTPSQKRAIHESGNNILVSAGAGSGKTGVLQQRVVEQLKLGKHIDELIILTFTNAAAFEMKSRIISSIQKEKSLEDELKRMDRAIISTFDAFCLHLVKEYHYLLDLPSQVVIGDRIQILSLEKQVLDAVIKNYYQKGDSDFETLVLRLFQKGDSILYETIQNFAKKISKVPDYSAILDNFEQYFSTKLLEQHFSEFGEELNTNKDLAIKTAEILLDLIDSYSSNSLAKFKASLNSMVNRLKNASSNDELIHTFLTVEFPNKPGGKKEEELKEILDQYHPKLKEYIIASKKALEEAYITDKQSAISSILETKDSVLKIVEITKQYIENLEEAKREINLYDYSDIMNFAIQLLEKHSDIADDYQNRIKEIMVDEYQDTNDLQDYFISLISNDNLFMVGDIKQSIYGFRDANPENFLKKYLDYSKKNGGIAINLRENFRSRKEVLLDINKTFEDVMDWNIGGINYKDHQSLEYGLTAYDQTVKGQHYGIDLISYDFDAYKEEDNYATKPLVEAQLLAKDIVSKITQKYQVLDDNFRDIEYKDIAILVDRKTDFELYSEILSTYNIPVNLFSDEPFMDSPEILFLISYLKLMKCFYDEEYLVKNFNKVFYSVARSFVFQIKDDIIIDFITKETITTISDLERLRNVPEFLELYHMTKELSGFVESLSIYELLLSMYSKLHLFQAISNLDNPTKKEEKLDYFAANIKSFVSFSFNDLILYLETIEEHKDWDIEYSKVHSNLNAVKLMTMHKAKGLQFPVVYCPGLSKKFNFMENKDFFLFDKSYGLITNAFDSGFYPTFLRKLSLDKRKKEYISERIRLLYVAFTRARENLILFADESSLKPELRQLDETGYVDHSIRLSYNKFTDLISSTSIAGYEYVFEPLTVYQNKSIVFTPKSNHVIGLQEFNFQKKRLEEKSYSRSMVQLLSDDVKSAIEFGTSTHKLLEDFDFEHTITSLKLLPSNIRASMEYFLSTLLFRKSDSPKIYQEYEFYESSNIGTKHGIIDLLMEYHDIIYIVDYKLKNISGEAYRLQLHGYKDYIQTKTNKPVQVFLYSILDQTLEEVE